MVMNKPRSAICARVLCLAAKDAGSASAADVYPGCAVPPTTFNHIWYIPTRSTARRRLRAVLARARRA